MPVEAVVAEVGVEDLTAPWRVAIIVKGSRFGGVSFAAEDLLSETTVNGGGDIQRGYLLSHLTISPITKPIR